MTAVTVVEQAAVDLYYDYSTVPEAHRETVRRSAITIKPRLKRAAEDIFVIGKELRATKALLPHGEYTNWLDVEFGLSDRMAQRFVNVYERLGVKSDKLSLLPPSTLYLLAAPSTPDAAIDAVEQQLAAGERIGVAFVQRAIVDAKQKAKQQLVDSLVIDGEVIHRADLTPETAERTATVQRLAHVLATVIDLLSVQLVADWAILFQTNELGRVREEMVRLQAALRTTGKATDVASE
jgi:hypothetical protein